VLNQINKAGITLLSNEDYLHIFHEIKNSITLINSSLQLVEKKHPEVREFDYWSESMSELCFLKNMVIQLSSARLCNQLNLMQVSIYSFMHQIDTSIRVLSWKNFVCNFQLEENLPLIELDPQLLKPYLYASYKYMSLEEYHILLTKHEEYLEVNAQMRQEMDDIRKNLQVEPNQQLVEKWKRRHRRSHT